MARTISLKTAIPGPESQALLARRAQAVPRGVSVVTPIAIAHAEGAVLTDVDGNRFIDFGGGIGVVNVGTAIPRCWTRSASSSTALSTSACRCGAPSPMSRWPGA